MINYVNEEWYLLDGSGLNITPHDNILTMVKEAAIQPCYYNSLDTVKMGVP